MCVVTNAIDAEAQQTQTGRRSSLPAWTISAAPIFTTERRGAHDSTLVIDVYGGTRLPNGTVVIGDNGAPNIKWFAPDGRFLRSVGRRGDGPGEYQLVELIGTCGSDSLFVIDKVNRRLSVLSHDGRLLGTRSMSVDQSSTPQSPSIIACGPNRRFALLGRPRGPTPSGDAPFRSDVVVRMQSLDGAERVDAGTTRSSERHRFGDVAGPRPLGKQSVIAISAQWLYVGTGDSASIHVYGLNGRRERDIPLPFERRRVARSDIQRFVSDLVRGNPRIPEATVRAMYADLAYPEYFPTHGALLVDAMHNLWVEEYRVPGQTSGSRWIVIGPQHTPIAEVRLPSRFRLLEVGKDYVLGTWMDEDHVRHVRVYRLTRS